MLLLEGCLAGDASLVLNTSGAERPGFRLRHPSAKFKGIMSRTIKDKPVQFRNDIQMYSGSYTGHYSWIIPYEMMKENTHSKFHSVPKLRKEEDYEYHWQSTPSEWTRMMMNRPMRRKLTNSLAKFKLATPDFELLEEFDEEEGYSHKPHQYWW